MYSAHDAVLALHHIDATATLPEWPRTLSVAVSPHSCIAVCCAAQQQELQDALLKLANNATWRRRGRPTSTSCTSFLAWLWWLLWVMICVRLQLRREQQQQQCSQGR